VIRIAAMGDVHAGVDSHGQIAPGFADIGERADVLLLAGDLTCHGTREEAAVLVHELAAVPIPMVAVLGNHDHHCDQPDEVVATLTEAGIQVLEGDHLVLDVADARLGVAGVKGFGGGFTGACASAFGEPEMKAFVEHTRRIADTLESSLAELDLIGADVRVALLHYSPVPETLVGERLEIYPFLGSYLLAEAIDRVGAHLALHGHAHAGTEHGATPGGVPVRNVAQPVLGAAYRVYALPTDGSLPLHAAAAGLPHAD
jgi:Icc-related predicted phosphoesterase